MYIHTPRPNWRMGPATSTGGWTVLGRPNELPVKDSYIVYSYIYIYIYIHIIYLGVY